MAFQGTEERLNAPPNNGNLLGLVQLVAKFYPVLQEHIRRISNDEIHDHYLRTCKRMQNEFIQLISNYVLKEILASVTKSKYYSVILDCTPDVSRKEQMTVVLRSIELGNKTVCIVENFVGFVHVQESTGIGLTKAFLHKIDELGLSISNCRGQGYDNGANMRGRISGVQA